jgi:hypothetical protein
MGQEASQVEAVYGAAEKVADMREKACEMPTLADMDAALIRGQRNRIEELERRLEEIEWLVEDSVDINENGGPNLAMQVMTIVKGLDRP